MKILLHVFAFALSAQFIYGQNLISNPDFELYSGLPSTSAQFYLATGWTNCGGSGSPDYFHTQGSGIVQLPNCFIGTVNPNSGNACVGGASYYYSPADFREYLSSQLISPLVIGTTYTVSMYVTNGITSGTYGGGGIDNLSVAFSTQPLTQSGTSPIQITPQITYAGMYYSQTWQQLSMQFVADSAYQFFTIGNFTTDANTVYQQFDPCSFYGAYYFFDDLSVEETATAPVALFNAPNHICPGTCIDFNNTSQNGTSFLWSFAGANPSASTDVNPVGICYNTPGSYTVELIATNSLSSDTLSLINYITVYPFPPAQGILQSGDTLFANPGAVSYQWYYNGLIIPGATEYSHVADSSGNYNVVATDANGCEVEAVIFDVIAGISTLANGNEPLALFPNPASETLTITSVVLSGKITIYNALGEKLSAPKSHISDSMEPAIIVDVSGLKAGLYILQISGEEKNCYLKFIKK